MAARHRWLLAWISVGELAMFEPVLVVQRVPPPRRDSPQRQVGEQTDSRRSQRVGHRREVRSRLAAVSSREAGREQAQ